jgi:hypothetical protein
MKILKKKKKYKGTRYVAKVLNKYFKNKYPNYNSALPKARELTEQLKASGQKFTVKNVESLVRTKRVKKEGEKQKSKAPLLFYKLTSYLPYFNLVDYPTYINDTTSEVYFVSDLFNSDVEETQGGKRPSYTKTFSGFVNFVNKEIDSEADEYNDEYLITCTKPEWNKELNRWESRIVTVNSNGEEIDYGYEPTGEPQISKIDQKLESEARITKKTKEKPLEKSDLTIQKELDLKLLKETSRQQANEMFLKGLYTKKEYKDEIARINNL